MTKFLSVDQLLQSEQGTIAKQRFIEVGTILKEYEEELYKKFLDNIIKNLPIYVKQNLLIDAEYRTTELAYHPSSYQLPLYITKKDQNHITPAINPTRSIVDKLQLYKEKCHVFQYALNPLGTKNKIEIKYLINYDPNFRESLIECQYFEKLGLNVPESIRQITLQHRKFEKLTDELCSMLEDYHLTIASLNTTEVSLLQSYIDQMQSIIHPGTTRISFGEISNFDYISQCKKQLEQFHSILNQIRKISSDVREHMEAIRFCVIDSIIPRHDDGIKYSFSRILMFVFFYRKFIYMSRIFSIS